MAAKVDALGRLHNLLAEVMVEELERQRAASDVNHSLMSTISRFLKDNHIEADEEESPAIQKLKSAAGTVLDFPFDPHE